MSAVVYHYTDTARLPWIVEAGELRPGRNCLGGFPDPDFLWATTLPIPDRTAASAGANALKAMNQGQLLAVQFVLDAQDFLTWHEIVQNFPAWTPSEIRRLERGANGKSSPATWRCRATPLPRSAWLGVEARGSRDRDWRPVNLGLPVHIFDADRRGFWIGDRLYCSERMTGAGGSLAYNVAVMERGNAA